MTHLGIRCDAASHLAVRILLEALESELVIAMSASFLFGVYYHYVLVSPDNVRHLPGGTPAAHARFSLSATILALIEFASVIAAAFVLVQRSRVGSDFALRPRQP